MKLPSSLVQQAREAAQPQRRSVAGQIESLDAIEARFVVTESSGRLAQAVRQTVQANRLQVAAPDRKAA